MMEHSDRPYHDRVKDKVGKEAEDMFELYLGQLGLVKQKDWLKTATSPWEHEIPLFWFYTDIILVPDYLVFIENELRLCEVKGTRNIKFEDYLKMYQMHKKAKNFDGVEVGMYYYNSYFRGFKWIPFLELQKMWKQMKHVGTYPEKDFRGKPKLYKRLPL